ncbi:MAG: glycoside hydrolase family 3 N-terminal domain-containing protein [Spirochaetales bacterium]
MNHRGWKYIVTLLLVSWLLSSCATAPPADPPPAAPTSDERLSDVPPPEPDSSSTPPLVSGEPDPTPSPDPEPDLEALSAEVPPDGSVQSAVAELSEAEADAIVEHYLQKLSRRQRIGQRFVTFVPGTRVSDGAHRLIHDVAPAGFILYPRNYERADQVLLLTRTLQLHSAIATPGISLFISADQEGGRVQAFEFPEVASMPSASVLGAIGDLELIRASSYVTHRQLRELGINMNLAPVLDLYETADESIIGDRSFGPDPIAVASFVEPILEASRAAGVISVAKHFPGHGITAIDSHRRLPVVAASKEELAKSHLIPFRSAVEAGVPALMTAHLLFRDIDPFFPVTLSEVFLHEILRHELGFDGVVITDGLEMWAIRNHFDIETTIVRLFQYDVDLILLYSEYDVIELVDLVEKLIRSRRISEDDVDRGVRRVLRLKLDYGLLAPATW